VNSYYDDKEPDCNNAYDKFIAERKRLMERGGGTGGLMGES
jgi:hypothetical protein